jgi:bacillithiol biosynthesis deacetylase BshB1
MADDGFDCVAFGAHPDDSELFAGGTLVQCARRGARVGIVHLTRGERGTRGTPEERRAEAIAAADVLGIPEANVHLLDLGDGRIENTEENRLVLIDLIRRLRPRAVLHHHPEDRHPDHRRAAELVADACYLAGVGGFRTDHPPFRPDARFMYLNNRTLSVSPTFVVDVSDVFESKRQALAAYASQFYNPEYPGAETYISSPEFAEQIVVRARYYGGLIGVRYGEPFVSPLPLPVTDPLALVVPRTTSTP